MDPVDLIIASLDVKRAFPNTPWLLLEAVCKRLGLPFYNFASGYIRTRKYTVRTGAGLTPFLESGSRVPQGGAESPFLYRFLTLLALAIDRDNPAYAPYPLLSPLVGFADDPEDATLPPKLQSHLAHLPRYASSTTKALSPSHQSLAYYLGGVLNASIGFQALQLTHSTTALQPATRAVTKAWAAHGGWPTSIPSSAIRAAWPH